MKRCNLSYTVTVALACSQLPLPACSLFLDKEEDNVIRLRSLEDAAAAATTTDHIERVSHPVCPWD